jgi:hypothetical protein
MHALDELIPAIDPGSWPAFWSHFIWWGVAAVAGAVLTRIVMVHERRLDRDADQYADELAARDRRLGRQRELRSMGGLRAQQALVEEIVTTAAVEIVYPKELL